MVNLCQVVAGDEGGGLVADTGLEPSWARVGEPDGALRPDCRDHRQNVSRHNVAAER